MASSIAVQTLQGFDDVQFRLSNSGKARLWDPAIIPDSWTTLRVGLCAVIPGTATLPSSNLAIGICSGITQPYGKETVQHFVGAKYGPSWTFSAGTPDNYQSVTVKPVKKNGSGETLGTTLTASVIAAAELVRVAFFVDITRGSPNYTIETARWSNPGSNDVTPDSFLTGMAVAMASINGWDSDYTAVAGQTVAVDVGTDGQFDAVNVFWDTASPTLSDCIIAVARLA
jgi:hypothetical protein